MIILDLVWGIDEVVVVVGVPRAGIATVLVEEVFQFNYLCFIFL